MTEKAALKERFFKVILGAGYSRTAAEGIVEEWFEFYLQGDVSKFIAMLEDYERDQKEEKCEN